MRYPLVYEALPDVAVHRLDGARAGDFGLLDLAFAGIGQQVKRIARAHDSGTGQRQRHARGVNRDPSATPLLCDIGRSAGPACGIHHQIARISGHKYATLQPPLPLVCTT